MNTTTVLSFVAVVFAAVFLLMLGLTTPASGDSRMRRTLRRRLERIGAEAQEDFASILREKYLTSLSPLERRLEELPFMQKLAAMGDQAGRPKPGYQVAMNSLIFALMGGVIGGVPLQSGFAGLKDGAALANFDQLRSVQEELREQLASIEVVIVRLDGVVQALTAAPAGPNRRGAEPATLALLVLVAIAAGGSFALELLRYFL